MLRIVTFLLIFLVSSGTLYSKHLAMFYPFIKSQWVEKYNSGNIDDLEIGGTLGVCSGFHPFEKHPTRSAALLIRNPFQPDALFAFHFHPQNTIVKGKRFFIYPGPSPADVSTTRSYIFNPQMVDHYVFDRWGVYRIDPNTGQTVLLAIFGWWETWTPTEND